MTGEAPARYCGACGHPLAAGSRFCGECGEAVAPVATAPTPPPAGPAPTPVPVPPAAPVGPPPGWPPAPPRASGGPPRWLVPVLAGVLVVALLATGLVLVLDRDEQAYAGEIFLAPAGVVGDDPFDPTSAEGPVVVTTATTTTSAPPATAGSATAVPAVSGGAVGLYGGTLDQSRCDVGRMSAFLQANPAQAGAFVAALNADPTLRWSGGNQVRVDQLPAYLRQLTPVTLTRDTRVTNHGYRDGRPVPLQTVLQSGTAVLVDRYGVPRSRCACGNPLTPPLRVSATPTYAGPRWPGFEPTTVVVVTEVTVEIDIFVLVDLTTGEQFQRPAGSTGGDDIPPTTTTTGPPATPPSSEPPVLGTGDVQVTLTFTGDIDVDLHVTDPDGTEIYYGNRTSPSGGQLDVDMIPSSGDVGTHVENVFWPTGGAPAGAYQVSVQALSGYTSATADFTVDVLVGGSRVAGTSGTLAAGERSETIEFAF